MGNVPTLWPESRFYWDAYITLSTKRIVSERGPQPIQMSEILAYAQYMRIDDDLLREDLFYMISALDTEYLGHLAKQKPSNKPGHKRQHKPEPRR